MKTFNDAKGNMWQIAMTIGAAKRIKDIAGIDIMDIQDGKLFESLGDSTTLFNVLWALCFAQAKEKGISDLDFAEALDGDAVEAATDAMLEEIIDFFPRAKRPLLRNMLQKVRSLEEKQTKAAMEMVNDPNFEKNISVTLNAGS